MKKNYKSLLLLGTLFFLLLVSIKSHATGSYQGREPGAAWRSKALDRIEEIRKSNLEVEVVDSKGRPISGAQVDVAMRRHSFGFGSAVTARLITAPSEEARRFREVMERDFNKVVFENDLKWGAWETASHSPTSIYRMENIDQALQWLKQRDIAVRGHCVVWAHLVGEGGTAKGKMLPPQDFRTAILRHAEEKVRRVGPRVSEWDVVNHPIGWGMGTMADLFGPTFYDHMFDETAKWTPQARRYINEGDVLPHNGKNRDTYYRLVSDMIDRGAKIEGIGFMGHFKGEQDLAAPEELLATFDRFAKLGVPLQVTEFDVRFGEEMEKPYRLTREQEVLQADYMRDFLIAAFSHPAVEGVVLWGFWEGRDWFPDAALYRKDWTIKPNGKVWEDLVRRQWWTNAKGETDGNGCFSVRGFLGNYSVTVIHGGKQKVVEKVDLNRAGTTLRVTID